MCYVILRPDCDFLIFKVFPRLISHLRELLKNVLEHRVALLIVRLYELAMDALKVRPLAVEAHNEASCVFLENFYADEV